MPPALADQRITLADGKTIDLKLPKGVEDGTQMRLRARASRARAGLATRWSRSRSRRTLLHARWRQYAARPAGHARRSVNGGKVKVPTAEGPVMLSDPAGSSSGKVLRLKGKGFTRKDGTRGDQLVTLEIALPEHDADLATRLEGWRDPRPVRARLGV
jgi:DnaJ-class molecular chaperone